MQGPICRPKMSESFCPVKDMVEAPLWVHGDQMTRCQGWLVEFPMKLINLGTVSR